VTLHGVVYDPVLHRSVKADGTEVPHVTGILSAVGASTNFEEMADRSPRMERVLNHARDRGTAVHADCHAYDDGDLFLETVDAVVLPYLAAWRQAREHLHLVPMLGHRERYLYEPTWDYAGIMDGLFTIAGDTAHDMPVLVDIKTGDPEDAAAHLQTAAYEQAWCAEQQVLMPYVQRWAIWLRPTRRVPYTVVDYTARPDHFTDVHIFNACVTVFRNQAARRRRIA
jgi:hypothetical protein